MEEEEDTKVVVVLGVVVVDFFLLGGISFHIGDLCADFNILRGLSPLPSPAPSLTPSTPSATLASRTMASSTSSTRRRLVSDDLDDVFVHTLLCLLLRGT